MSSLPLSGIRVLELSHTVMGPTAGLVLADHAKKGARPFCPAGLLR